jgi:MoaA/NifB/PqqE/SkfB family radical SAM enzyme
MSEDQIYLERINGAIKRMFRDAVRISLAHPSLGWFMFQTLLRQKKAAGIRRDLERQGVHAPPFMIASITSQCNLRCKGCYAQAQHRPSGTEMSADRMRQIFQEARELGISIILLAGGEPLVRRDILELTSGFPEIIFPVFTNGLLLDEEMAGRFQKQKNIIPIISLEGHESETDGRRGKGVYGRLQETISRIGNQGIFWGTSLTLTRANFGDVTGDEFVKNLTGLGCKLFFYVEYVPIREGTEDWVLTGEQRVRVTGLMDSFRAKYPGLFIAFPGDEAELGGCLASGRGFVHISPEGNLEPCPFAPYSDTNLRDLTLREALQSDFLKTIRENHDQLTETEGGCALWDKREWVQSLLSGNQLTP